MTRLRAHHRPAHQQEEDEAQDARRRGVLLELRLRSIRGQSLAAQVSRTSHATGDKRTKWDNHLPVVVRRARVSNMSSSSLTRGHGHWCRADGYTEGDRKMKCSRPAPPGAQLPSSSDAVRAPRVLPHPRPRERARWYPSNIGVDTPLPPGTDGARHSST